MATTCLRSQTHFDCYVHAFSDVVTIEKTGEHFRLIYDVKGRFTIHRISAEEAKVSTGDSFGVICL